MSTEQNKTIAKQLLQDISNGNVDAAMSVLAEDLSWWIAGNIPQFSGAHPKPVIGELFKQMGLMAPQGMNITVTNIVAEGDYVAVEGNSNAQLPTGNYYQNKYHWLFEFKDGKVKVAKEYMDTLLFKETMESMMP